VAAVTLPNDFTGERLALCLIYSSLWGGAFMAVSAALPFRAASMARWQSTIRVILHIFVIMLGGAALPFWFAKFLPQTFAGLGGPMANPILAWAGIAIASYFYYPPIVARAGRSVWKSAPPKPETRRGFGDQLTGLSFLVWKEARRTALLIGIAFAIGLGYWVIFERPTSLADFIQSGYALPFANRPAHPHGMPIGFLILAGVSDLDLVGDLRRLRCMPLSVARLAALLTSTGLLFAAVLWICLLAVQLLVDGGFPVTLRPDLFLTVAGGIALSQTARMVRPVSGVVNTMLGGVFTAPAFIAFALAPTSMAWTPAVLLMAAGVTALALSFLINQWSIRNNSRIYKRAAFAVSFLPQDPR
jgi:hypothetical protein